MANLYVDLKWKTVNWHGRPKYWWRTKHKRRTWYRKSKKHGYHTYGDGNILDHKKRTIAELNRLASEAPIHDPYFWEPAQHRITTRETLDTLNQIVDQAEEEHRKKVETEREKEREIQEQQRQAQKKEAQQAGSDRPEHGPQPLNATSPKSGDAGRGEKKRAKHRSSVSFALKSEVSDYVLNLRAAPSKRQKGLYNVSIHLGSKFLGYAEVRPEVLGELGQRLMDLSKHATHVAD